MRVYTYCFSISSGGEMPVEIRIFASSALVARRELHAFLSRYASRTEGSILRYASVTRVEPGEASSKQRLPPISSD
jgi:hypothetical protein